MGFGETTVDDGESLGVCVEVCESAVATILLLSLETGFFGSSTICSSGSIRLLLVSGIADL